jgi:hypothetical protein
MGPWRSWERVSFAPRRSRVQIPQAPPEVFPGLSSGASRKPIKSGYREVAQLGSALASGARGRRFKSGLPDGTQRPRVCWSAGQLPAYGVGVRNARGNRAFGRRSSRSGFDPRNATNGLWRSLAQRACTGRTRSSVRIRSARRGTCSWAEVGWVRRPRKGRLPFDPGSPGTQGRRIHSARRRSRRQKRAGTGSSMATGSRCRHGT